MNPQEKAEISKDVADLIIKELNIGHITAEEVDPSLPLFGKDSELELDSVDGITIVVALQKTYGVRLDDRQPAREILTSIDTVTEFLIRENATVRKI